MLVDDEATQAASGGGGEAPGVGGDEGMALQLRGGRAG
jgi:hypothetical protein